MVCLYCLCNYLYYALSFRHPRHLFIYLTTWGLTVLVVQQVLDALIALVAYANGKVNYQ